MELFALEFWGGAIFIRGPGRIEAPAVEGFETGGKDLFAYAGLGHDRNMTGRLTCRSRNMSTGPCLRRRLTRASVAQMRNARASWNLSPHPGQVAVDHTNRASNLLIYYFDGPSRLISVGCDRPLATPAERERQTHPTGLKGRNRHPRPRFEN